MKKKLLFFALCVCLIAVFTFSSAFLSSAAEYDYTVIDGGVSLCVNFYTAGTNVVVPSTINGLPVIRIESPYSTDGHINSLTVPNTLKSIYFELSIGFDDEFYVDRTYVSDLAAWSEVDVEIGGDSGCFSFGNLYVNRQLVTEVLIPEGVTTIGDYAFYYFENIASVSIPNSVTSVGDYAFPNDLKYYEYGNALYLGNSENPYLYLAKAKSTNITSCTIHKDTKFIGYDAFYNCTKLKTVTFAENSQLTSIGDDAFYRCSGLTSITIPSSVTSIGSSAFGGCTGLTSITFGENSKLTSIGSSAFGGCTGLMSITIPSSVTSIGSSAFRGCTSLTSITIPSSVTSIGSSAFDGCTGLTSITIPDGVMSIGYDAFGNTAYYNDESHWENGVLYIGNHLIAADDVSSTYSVKEGTLTIAGGAFEDCDSLTSITIPSSVTSIGSSAFDGCTGLMSITFGENSKLTSIGSSAFYRCSGLTSITIPSSVTSIGSSAFEDCDSLTSITIPSSVTSIGNYAFYGCTSLKTVAYRDTEEKYRLISFGSSPTDPTKISGVTVIFNARNYVFYDEDGVTVLKEGTVSKGTVITAPTLPDRYIDKQYSEKAYFDGFTAGMTLENDAVFVTKYEKVLNRYTYTFLDDDGTTVLKQQTVDYGTTITAPANPTKAATAKYTYTFSGFDGFTSGMTVTGDVSFKAKYNSTINKYTYTFFDENGTTVLKQQTVDYGTVITAPANPTKAATAKYTYTFAGFGGFTSGMTVTGDVSFKAKYNSTINKYTYTFFDEDGATVLKMNTVDYGTTIVPPTNPTKDATAQYTYTFAGFDGYTSGMKVEGNVAFKAKYNATVNKYTYVFYDEDGRTVLKSTTVDYGTVIVAPSNPTKASTPEYRYPFSGFEGYTSGMKLTGNVNFKATYQKTNRYLYTVTDNKVTITGVNDTFSGAVTVPSTLGGKTVTAIGANAFEGCKAITSITLPDTVTSIGDKAFMSCSNLTSFTVPKGVKTIPHGMFSMCKSLESVTLNEGLEVIAWYAFNACYALKSITIPDSVTTIEEHAFTHCSALETLTLGSGVTTIGTSAFNECKKLSTVRFNGAQKQYHAISFDNDIAKPTCYGATLVCTKGSYTFLDADGKTVLKEAIIDFGAVIVAPNVPDKRIDVQYSNRCTGFEGFSEGMVLTEDATFVAQYKKVLNQYTYAFFDENGTTILKQQTVDYGTVITAPASPYKQGNAQYSYTFAGFDGYTSGMKVTSDVTFTAKYTRVTNKYTYIFYDEDGTTVLKKTTAEYGTTIKAPANPTKEGTAKYTYTFAGFDGFTNGMTLKSNVEFTAKYNATVNKYTYTFFDEDGTTVLKRQTANYGSTISAPANPTKAKDQKYSYSFKGFEGFAAGMTLTENVSFVAEYEATLNKYTVTFLDDDGRTVLKSATEDYGTVIVAPTVTTKRVDAQHSKVFECFEGFTEGIELVEDVSFVAKYTVVFNQYTYVFYAEDGTTVLSTATVEYGTPITAPTAPDKPATAQYTYTFAGFQGFSEGMVVTRDVTFVAKYNAILNKYTYTFYDEDGKTVLKNLEANYGSVIVSPSNPKKAATAQYTYTFVGFDGFIRGMTLTEDVTFVAKYNATVNQYTYTFFDEDGSTVLKRETVDYGSVIVPPTVDPFKDVVNTYTPYFPRYTEGMTLQKDISFTLEYVTGKNKYTCTFLDDDGVTVLRSEILEYGTLILPPSVSDKEDNLYTYTFKEWQGYASGMTLTENVTFTATYTATLKGVLALQSTVTETAWGLEFVSTVMGTQVTGTGGRFVLVLNELVASFVDFETADGVTVEQNGNIFTVTVTRAVEENETLLSLTLKTSDFLASGEHAFLSLAEDETATATFAPIVIHEIGDVDGNGAINVLDALLLKQHLVEIVTLDSVQLAYADADPDGEINVLDAMYIEQFIVEIRDTLGDRAEVVFVTETEETTYTVVVGEELTTVPEAPEGFLWSAEAETYVPPVFTFIVNGKNYYYLVKE